MDLHEMVGRFPTKEDCIKYLEAARWKNGPVCPYCFEQRYAAEKSQARYHCNACNTSFSVTVNTIFHDTKLPLQKWFLAILLLYNNGSLTAKQLQHHLGVTYKTAWYLAMRVRRAIRERSTYVMEIVKMEAKS